VLFLDEAIMAWNADFTPLKEFILPGGARPPLAHVRRTVYVAPSVRWLHL
jgi:cob(I)alamin adenosyltransferase